ncbi:MAG: hypothetical protein ACOC9Y_04500, partial [Chloroflexota bacterium]
AVPETLVDSMPADAELCANRYNGNLTLTEFGCAVPEIAVEPETVCVNRYNGNVRVPQVRECSPVEITHRWAIE